MLLLSTKVPTRPMSPNTMKVGASKKRWEERYGRGEASIAEDDHDIDQIIAGRVLKIASSAAFVGAAQIDSLRGALMRFGMNTQPGDSGSRSMQRTSRPLRP